MELTISLSGIKDVKSIYPKVHRLLLAISLRKFSVCYTLAPQFDQLFMLIYWLCLFSAFFSYLDKKNFILLLKSLKLLARCSGIIKYIIADLEVQKHFHNCWQIF